MTPLYERFDTEAAYRNAIDLVIAKANGALRIFDKDLARMQLEAPERIALLQSFLTKTPAPWLRIVLRDASDIERAYPRLVDLLERYAHIFSIRTAPDNMQHLADCHVIADEIHCVRRFHIDHARGAVNIDDPVEVLPWLQRFDELWDLSQSWSGGHRLTL